MRSAASPFEISLANEKSCCKIWYFLKSVFSELMPFGMGSFAEVMPIGNGSFTELVPIGMGSG